MSQQHAQKPGPTILVVEDEPGILKVVGRVLRTEGYHVLTAATASAATTHLRQQRIDALLVDFRLPDARGDSLFYTAVGLQPHLEHHTLFMTGDHELRTENAIAQCGCPCLDKPFDIEVLRDRVAAVLLPADRQRNGKAG